MPRLCAFWILEHKINHTASLSRFLCTRFWLLVSFFDLYNTIFWQVLQKFRFLMLMLSCLESCRGHMVTFSHRNLNVTVTSADSFSYVTRPLLLIVRLNLEFQTKAVTSRGEEAEQKTVIIAKSCQRLRANKCELPWKLRKNSVR